MNRGFFEQLRDFLVAVDAHHKPTRILQTANIPYTRSYLPMLTYCHDNNMIFVEPTGRREMIYLTSYGRTVMEFLTTLPRPKASSEPPAESPQ